VQYPVTKCDLQRGEVHPSHVQAMLQAMQESLQLQGGDAAEEPPVALPAAVPNEEIRPLRRPAIRRREPDEQ